MKGAERDQFRDWRQGHYTKIMRKKGDQDRIGTYIMTRRSFLKSAHFMGIWLSLSSSGITEISGLHGPSPLATYRNKT